MSAGRWSRRLSELGIVLPPPPPPVANFAPARRSGSLLFVSGQGPVVDGRPVITGSLGAGVSIERGYEAARLCALNSIAVAADVLGDLERIRGVVKVLAFVSSDRGFFEQPSVVNGASDLFVELFGDPGRHARSALGTHVLPFDIAVEIEVAFDVGAGSIDDAA